MGFRSPRDTAMTVTPSLKMPANPASGSQRTSGAEVPEIPALRLARWAQILRAWYCFSDSIGVYGLICTGSFDLVS